MNSSFESLRSPKDGSRLRRSDDALMDEAGRSFPIVNGIPRFVDAANYATDFGKQWNRFPKTQLDSYTGLPISRDRLRRCIGGELTQLAGKRVLEAGSGAGRFTEVLLDSGAVLDTFDFSSAVEANARNNADAEFTLAQGDIREMPFERGVYDYVICLGVLQHTPSPEQSIAALWEMLRPGGRLIIDHYAWNLWLRLPPPLGDAEKVYRHFVLRMAPGKRARAVERIVDFWFPIYWRFRKSKWARRILARIGGIHFYYGSLPLRDREEHYVWSLLDTHDGMTDHFKFYRSEAQITQCLTELGATEIVTRIDGNGVEASARKPG